MGIVNKEGTGIIVLPSSPVLGLGGARSHCWQELVTDGMLISTLGTWLGCVGAPFSVSWLLVLVKEIFGTEMSVEASCE